MATGDGADGQVFPGEAGRVFLEAEAATLGLLETAEQQQEAAKDLQLGVQTAIRDLALEKFELGKVATAIAESHKGYKEAIGGAVAEFQKNIAGADKTISGYVVAALERHQGVIAGALKEAVERAVGQMQQVTEEAATETLASLRLAALAGQDYAESAKDGVKAFQRRQWRMLLAAFVGGVAAAIAGAATFHMLRDDGGREVGASQLDGRISALQQQHDQLRQEVNTLKPPPRR